MSCTEKAKGAVYLEKGTWDSANSSNEYHDSLDKEYVEQRLKAAFIY